MSEGIPGTNKASAIVADGRRWLDIILSGIAGYRELRDRFRRDNQASPEPVEDPFLDDEEIAALAKESKDLGVFAGQIKDKHSAPPTA
jgi:hypothetical protein